MRVAFDPRDDLSGVVDVRSVDRLVTDQRAVFAQDIHHRRLVVAENRVDVSLQAVWHVVHCAGVVKCSRTNLGQSAFVL